MPYTGTPPGGISHGKSVKNPATYEALMREGHTQSEAAAISNSALNKGFKKGRHHSKKRTRKRSTN
jgi:hypothetical protein